MKKTNSLKNHKRLLWGAGIEMYSKPSLLEELNPVTIAALILTGVIALVFFFCAPKEAWSSEIIDMHKIMMIESGGRNVPSNVQSEHAIGVYQLTPICLKEWNSFHPNDQHTRQDLWNVQTNTKIASWMLNQRIPQMLRAYKKPVTTRNIIIAWNAGINYVRTNKPLPKITQSFLKKYEA